MKAIAEESLKDFAERTYSLKVGLGVSDVDAKRETWKSCMHFCRGYFCNSKVPFAEVFDEIDKVVNELGVRNA